MRKNHPTRRGLASILAMLFLMLFSIMALGFYASVTTSQQVAGNDQRVAHAALAAESGMEFMRYQMSRMTIPSTTADGSLTTEAYADLPGLLNNAAYTVGLSGGIVSIPSASNQYITIDNDSKFRATIFRNASTPAGQMTVHVIGVYGTKNVQRAIEMQYKGQVQTSQAFSYGVASAGGIVMSKGGVVSANGSLGGLLSTSSLNPAINATGGTIQGDLAVITTTSAINSSGATITGSKKVVSDPGMPTFDTSSFAAYATNTWTSSMSSPFINCRVPAGSNPSFNGGAVIQGILYVEAPNTVTFKGSVTIQGFVVFQNAGSDATNSLTFKGSANMDVLPAGAAYDAMRSLSGIGIFAPSATVAMQGSTDTTLNDSLICSKFSYTGAANITINNGALISTSTAAGAVNLAAKTLTFTGNSASNPPSVGVVGSAGFFPQPKTYLEVTP